MSRISLNRKILAMVLAVAFASQAAYVALTLRAFQRHHLRAVSETLSAVGGLLAENLSGILARGVSLEKLAGIEDLFSEVLSDVPEMGCLAIREAGGDWLYYAERGRFRFGAALGGRPFPGPADPVDFAFPLAAAPGGVSGELVLGINRDLVTEQVRAMALDSGTLALISLLAILDFMLFAMAVGVSLPLRRVAGRIRRIRSEGPADRPVGRTGISPVDRLLDRFDRIRAVSLTRLKGPVPESPPLTDPVLIRPAVFLFVFSEALSISFLPLYAKQLYAPMAGLSEEVALGLPISAFMLFTALSLPVGGWLAEAWGCRKAFPSGCLLCGAGLFFSGAAESLPGLVLFRCLTGFGFGIAFMTAQHFIVSATGEKRRAEGMAMFLSAFYAGTLCGTAIGGMVADRVGFHHLFHAGAVLAAVSALFAFRVIPEAPGRRQALPSFKGALPSPKVFFRLLSDRHFFALAVLQAIPNKIGLIGLVYFAAPLMLREQGTDPSDAGRVIMGYSLVMILLGQAVSRWSDRRGLARPQVFWGGLLSGLSLIPFLFFSGIGMVTAGVLLLGLSHTLSVANQLKLASELEAVQALGTGIGLGVYRQVERAGNVAAPLLMGALASGVGFGRALALVGGLTVISSLLFQAVFRPPKEASS